MSTSVRVVWHGNQFMARLERESELRMRTACEALKSDIVRSISVPVSGGRKDGKGRFAGVSAGRSRPGEPPRADTGHLRRSFFTSVYRDARGIVGMVGTLVKYGLWLEYGTKKMAPRPYFRPALARMRSKIAQIFSKKMPSKRSA